MHGRLLVATILAGGLAAPALAVTPGYTPVIEAPGHAGGTFSVGAKHQDIQGVKAVCIDLDFQPADGTDLGAGGGCIGGDLRAVKKLAPVVNAVESGGQLQSRVIGGIVTAKARKVVIRFDDGKQATARTVKGPAGFRRELGGARVRWFGLDALSTSTAIPRTALAYNARGRKLTKVTVTKR